MESSRKERKIVTVLFADLVGFTARAEQLDPEDVEAILRPYHERLRSELERFGGTVEKFIGDAVMALFGAPVAHEDDPERAVRAALAIRDWASDEDNVQVRIAVNSGEALITLGARLGAGEGMAAGDVVNTAARLQGAAAANGVLVGQTTYRATRDAIDYREAEPVRAKGKAQPVRVWEAIEARSRFGVDVSRAHTTPLVGRERELGVLRETFARVRADKSAQLVTIVGVPGIGKSRLVFELMQEVAAERNFVTWRQGRSVPYGEGVGFSALAEIVKAEAGIVDGDPAQETEEKLARAVEAADDVEWLLRHLCPLVGVRGDAPPAADKSERFAAWRHFLESMAEEQPAVFVFEDVHWAGDALLDFLDHLVDWASGVRMLVVVTARPELLERRPSWGGGKLNATTVALSPLRSDETTQLLSSLVDESYLDATDRSALVDRVGGNPLYAEQYARLLAERGPQELRIPENVEGIIAARLDTLAPQEKRLLQDGAVFGKVFWSDAVATLGGGDKASISEALHALERKDFVQRARRSSVAGSDEYAFRHVLLRDVAYGQLPRAERGDKHRLAAQWLESLASDDHAATVAHHWSTALELARTSGQTVEELTGKARLALIAAGDRALNLNAWSLAVTHYGAALELTLPDAADRPQLLLRSGRARWLTDETGAEEVEKARDALLAADDHSGAAEAEVLLANVAQSRADRAAEESHLDAATSLLVGTPASPTKAFVLSEVARSHLLGGAYYRALQECADALEAADVPRLEQVRASVLNTRGVARVNLGDREGVADIEESLAVALRSSSVVDVVRAYNNLAATVVDDIRRTHELNLAALDVAQKIGAEPFTRWIRGNLAGSYFDVGDWDEALRVADEFVAEIQGGRPHAQEITARGIRAMIRSARSDLDGALADAERVVEISRGGTLNLGLTPNLALYSCLLIDVGRRDEAAVVFDELLTVARALEAPGDIFGHEVAIAARALGRADQLVGIIERLALRAPLSRSAEAVKRYAQGDFAATAELRAQTGDVTAEAFARLAAGRAFIEEGRREEAEEQLMPALTFFRSVGATRYISEIESLLATAT